jgi:hypothetical protein
MNTKKLSRLQRELLSTMADGVVLMTTPGARCDWQQIGGRYKTWPHHWRALQHWRLEYFGDDNRSTQASTARALRRLMERGLVDSGFCQQACPDYPSSNAWGFGYGLPEVIKQQRLSKEQERKAKENMAIAMGVLRN